MRTVHKSAADRPGVAIFQHRAGHYDAWFGSARGQAIFESEVRCLRHMSQDLPRPWLEVGVGTGRFARALGIDVGVDPAARMLTYAAKRGVRVAEALGDALPFDDGSFGAVFIVVTVCFAQDPAGLLREARRVLRKGGGGVLGIVPAEGPWGKFYRAKAKRGHPFYSEARFFSPDELGRLAREAGLHLRGAACTLLQNPQDEVILVEPARDGLAEKAGFVSLLYGGQSDSHAGGVGAEAP